MAAAARNTGAPTRAPAFTLNGVSYPIEDPYPFLDQAHGVLACIEEALNENERGPINRELLISAVRGASMLVHLAALGLDNMDSQREGR